MSKYSMRFWLIFTFLVMMASLGRAAVDRTPDVRVGAVYKTSRSTLANGDFDSLAMDANHNLLVSSSSSPSSTKPTQFGETSSNGVTAVTLVTGTASLQVVPWMMTFYNTDTVAHKVQVISSGGTVLWSFVLAASTGAAVYDGNSDSFSIRTVASENLQFKLPNFGTEGGTGTTVTAIGWTTTQ